MASHKKGRDDSAPKRPGVRRGGARKGDRTRLPDELEEFVRSDEKRFRPKRPPRRPRLKDPREGGVLIPGVANRDSRALYERRLAALQAAPESERGRLLAEAYVTRIWRGYAITTFEAFIENVLGWELEASRAAAEEGAKQMNVALEPLRDEDVALWLRVEIGLADAPSARVTIDGATLKLSVSLEEGMDALTRVGKVLLPLERDRH